AARASRQHLRDHRRLLRGARRPGPRRGAHRPLRPAPRGGRDRADEGSGEQRRVAGPAGAEDGAAGAGDAECGRASPGDGPPCRRAAVPDQAGRRRANRRGV
ncbi:MAG: hypothetical protein AVDCRST_MAG68-3236, partial [uncultured Gemmatimonadetes bacterium]